MGHMSFMMSGPNASRDDGLPRGELVSTHTTRAAAQEQLEKLVQGDVPPTAVTIVGKDLRVVERVRGRMSYPQVALSAGLRGLLFGSLIGLFMYLIAPQGGAQQILFSALLGVGLWMILGVIAFAMRKDSNGFASTQQVVPAAYDVVVAFEHAGRARGVLNAGTGQAVPAAVQPGPQGQSAQQDQQGVPTTAPASAPQGASGPDGTEQAPAPQGPQPGQTPHVGQGGQTGHDRQDGAPQAQRQPEGPQTQDGQQAEPAQPAQDGQQADGSASADGAPQGLDRTYGLRLSQEEVDRIIAARGGTPGQQPPEPPQGGSGR